MTRTFTWPTAPEPLRGTVIDSHTHLDVYDKSLHGELPPDPSELLDQARAVGVDRVVQVGCDVNSSRWALEAATRFPNVVATVALHPNEAPRPSEESVKAVWTISELLQLAEPRNMSRFDITLI